MFPIDSQNNFFNDFIDFNHSYVVLDKVKRSLLFTARFLKEVYKS